MTKKKMNELVLQACADHGASEELTKILDDLTRPKVGGSSQVSDYTCFGEDGNPEYIFCTYHNKWEPLVDDEGVQVFAADAKSKNGYRRSCIVGEKQWSDQAKIFRASEKAVITDVLDGKLTPEDGKAKIAELTETRQIHTPREDGVGEDERPCE